MAESSNCSAIKPFSTECLSSSNGKKHCKNENEDRIGGLPDELICHILSFLPTKYAVGTSILSSRWRYLWTSVPVLHFEDSFGMWPSRQLERERLFKNSMDTVLSSHNVRSIQKFYLHFPGKCNVSRVNKWINVAIASDVVELDLDIWIGKKDVIQLPQNLFSCAKLKVLKLGNKRTCEGIIILNFPDSVSLPNLKVLVLRYLKLLNKTGSRKLLYGAPVLEKLEIIGGYDTDIPMLYVNSYSLKNLMIQQHYKVDVNAPNLEFLELKVYLSNELKLQLPLIVKAQIDVSRGSHLRGFNASGNEALQLLRQISNVKFLCLTASFLKELNEGKQKHLAAHNLVTFHNLTYLKVTVETYPWSLHDVLEYMPNLEVILLDIKYHNDYVLWHPQEFLPSCLLSCLAMVHFKCFQASKGEIRLAKYFLKKAKVLQKMMISCYQRSTNPIEVKKLLTFRRISTKCLFVESESTWGPQTVMLSLGKSRAFP